MQKQPATASTENAVVSVVSANPVIVLTDDKVYSDFYKQMKEEVSTFEPDLTTKTGRDKIAALAYKVTRTKTAIDAAGKKLNEEARAQINVVDVQRRKIREELEALAEEARKPLTEWEAAEEARLASIKATLAHIEGVGRGFIGPDLQPYGLLFRELDEKIVLDVATFGEFLPEAQTAVVAAREKLTEAQAREEQATKERAELERLRAEAAERERKDAEERAAREKAEAEARAAAEAKARAEAEEKSRMEAAQLERERIQKEEQDKAQAAVREAEKREAASKAEAERIQREADARIQAAEDAARMEKERLDLEAKRIAAEQAARDADKAHRGKVMKEAKKAVMVLGIDEETAKKVILAIVAGEVPSVSLRF